MGLGFASGVMPGWCAVHGMQANRLFDSELRKTKGKIWGQTLMPLIKCQVSSGHRPSCCCPSSPRPSRPYRWDAPWSPRAMRMTPGPTRDQPPRWSIPAMHCARTGRSPCNSCAPTEPFSGKWKCIASSQRARYRSISSTARPDVERFFMWSYKQFESRGFLPSGPFLSGPYQCDSSTKLTIYQSCCLLSTRLRPFCFAS